MKAKANSLPPIKNNSNLNHSKKLKPKPSTQKIGDYIHKSMKYIDNGCYENGQLKIDGGIGDYRMSIFRLKDRKKRINEIPTSFTSKFVKDISELTPDLKDEIERLSKVPNQHYLKPEKDQNVEEIKQHIPPKWESEQQEHLLYHYLPIYQRQKWFTQTVDKSNTYRPQKIEISEEKKFAKKMNKRKSDRKHFFRFLDNNNSGII